MAPTFVKQLMLVCVFLLFAGAAYAQEAVLSGAVTDFHDSVSAGAQRAMAG